MPRNKSRGKESERGSSQNLKRKMKMRVMRVVKVDDPNATSSAGKDSGDEFSDNEGGVEEVMEEVEMSRKQMRKENKKWGLTKVVKVEETPTTNKPNKKDRSKGAAADQQVDEGNNKNNATTTSGAKPRKKNNKKNRKKQQMQDDDDDDIPLHQLLPPIVDTAPDDDVEDEDNADNHQNIVIEHEPIVEGHDDVNTRIAQMLSTLRMQDEDDDELDDNYDNDDAPVVADTITIRDDHTTSATSQMPKKKINAFAALMGSDSDSDSNSDSDDDNDDDDDNATAQIENEQDENEANDKAENETHEVEAEEQTNKVLNRRPPFPRPKKITKNINAFAALMSASDDDSDEDLKQNTENTDSLDDAKKESSDGASAADDVVPQDSIRNASDVSSDEFDSEEDWVEEVFEPWVTDLKESLFDGNHSRSYEVNIRYMLRKHSFFIPNHEHLKDPSGEALFSYLQEKICRFHTCVWCQKMLYSLEAVRGHMKDKAHQKIHFDKSDALSLKGELSQFYDETIISEPRKPRRKPKVEINASGELVLASGVQIGHRSMRRYYKQGFGSGYCPPTAYRSLEEKRLQRKHAKKTHSILMRGQMHAKFAESKAIVSQYTHKADAADNAQNRAIVHHWGAGGGGSHMNMAGSRQYQKGVRVKGVILRHSRQGARVQGQAQKNKQNRGDASMGAQKGKSRA